jgi:hypothetical protein
MNREEAIEARLGEIMSSSMITSEAMERLASVSGSLDMLQPLLALGDNNPDSNIVKVLCTTIQQSMDVKYMQRTLIDGKFVALSEVINTKIANLGDEIRLIIDEVKRTYALRKDLQEVSGELGSFVKDQDFLK